MGNNVPVTQTTNIVPVQGIFQPEPTFALISLIGPAGTPFYAPFNPVQSGLTITGSTINSSVIGGTVPAAGYFTSIYATTGQVATSPSADIDIANKAYVDSVAQGLDVKASCVYATTGNITLSGLAVQAGGDWASSLTAADRILVKNQTAQADNGIYAWRVHVCAIRNNPIRYRLGLHFKQRRHNWRDRHHLVAVFGRWIIFGWHRVNPYGQHIQHYQHRGDRGRIRFCFPGGHVHRECPGPIDLGGQRQHCHCGQPSHQRDI